MARSIPWITLVIGVLMAANAIVAGLHAFGGGKTAMWSAAM